MIEGTGSFEDESGRPSLQGETLVRRWRKDAPAFGFLAVFAILWNGIVAGGVYVAIADLPVTVNGRQFSSMSEASRADPSVVIFLLFPLIGAVLLYVLWAVLLNRTRISISGGQLTISQGPLPWRRARQEFPASSLTQFYVEQYSSHTQNNQPALAYRLKARRLEGPPVIIDSGFGNYEDARILEQWIEARLAITDQRVPGEVVV
jgi:hypothetical protein